MQYKIPSRQSLCRKTFWFLWYVEREGNAGDRVHAHSMERPLTRGSRQCVHVKWIAFSFIDVLRQWTGRGRMKYLCVSIKFTRDTRYFFIFNRNSWMQCFDHFTTLLRKEENVWGKTIFRSYRYSFFNLFVQNWFFELICKKCKKNFVLDKTSLLHFILIKFIHNKRYVIFYENRIFYFYRLQCTLLIIINYYEALSLQVL